MKAELVEIPTEVTDTNIKQYLADCSSVVRIKQPRDNDKLFERLLKESYGGKASRVFEYVPCTLNKLQITNHDQLFGFYDSYGSASGLYYTNARELFNWGWKWEDILKCIDFTHYRTIKVTAPYFLYGQASTHNQITSVSHSNRYTEANLGYWCPPEYFEWRQSRNLKLTKEDVQKSWDKFVLNRSPRDLESYMKKALGIKRREVSARGSDMLQNRVYTLGGYTNNPNAWEHFINQRMVDKHTQFEMRKLAVLINIELTSTAHKINQKD